MALRLTAVLHSSWRLPTNLYLWARHRRNLNRSRSRSKRTVAKVASALAPSRTYWKVSVGTKLKNYKYKKTTINLIEKR